MNYRETEPKEDEDLNLSWSKLEAGVFVGPSTLEGAGRGVFATTSFEGGDVVTEYVGRIIKDSTVYKLALKHQHYYIAQIDRVWSIDGERWPGIQEGKAKRVGSLINDSRGLLPYNVKTLRCSEFRKRLFVVATRAISPGEELFLNYGKGYWETQKTCVSPLINKISVRDHLCKKPRNSR